MLELAQRLLDVRCGHLRPRHCSRLRHIAQRRRKLRPVLRTYAYLWIGTCGVS